MKRFGRADAGTVGNGPPIRRREDRFLSREVILEARTGSQLLYLSTTVYEPDAMLLTRSGTNLGASEYRITSIEVRQSL